MTLKKVINEHGTSVVGRLHQGRPTDDVMFVEYIGFLLEAAVQFSYRCTIQLPTSAAS